MFGKHKYLISVINHSRQLVVTMLQSTCGYDIVVSLFYRFFISQALSQ